jgi:hypothetical protein
MQFAPPPTTDYEVDIGPDEVRFYRDNGYLVCGQVTTPEELAWLSDVYDTLINIPMTGFLDTVYDVMKPYGSKTPPKLGQLLRPEMRVPEVHQTAMWRNARRIASKLLDLPLDEIEHWGHMVYKTPGGDNETPWHQDEAYWDISFDYYAIGAWLPLQDVNEDNGCMWFVPGSHKGEVLAHRHLGDDPAVHVLELDEKIDESLAVPIRMKAGAMSFHHPRTLHFARSNVTGSMRRAWANEFQSAPITRKVPANRPWVTAGKQALAERATA